MVVYGRLTVGWCVCGGRCVRVSHVFGVGSPKVRDVMRHTSPFTGGWWFLLFYGWFTVGGCVCSGWCVRVSHIFGVGSPKVPDVMRHTSPFTGGWWFLSMVGLRLDGVFVVAGVFVSLTSSELVARRCMMLCDTPRLLLVVGGFYSWFKFNLAMCLYWGVVFLLVMGSATMQRLIFSQIFQGGGCFPSVSTGCLLFKKPKQHQGAPRLVRNAAGKVSKFFSATYPTNYLSMNFLG